VERSEFEALVLEALEAIPEGFRKKMENVDILVEDRPHESVRLKGKRRPPSRLLGLYRGVPLSKRSVYYSAALPDKIVLYQKAIESISGSREDIKRALKEVIIHELGHHFGLSEDDLSP
jgi:predicted Zn-dependent protease with MMP-like domain